MARQPGPDASDVPPQLMTADGREALRCFYRDQLLDDTLPFWFPRAIDQECGGYLHCRDRDCKLLDSDKSVWAQGRTAWMLLTLYRFHEQRPEWLTWAESGLRFLREHCFDADGRMFFHVTRDGQPIRKRRYAYSEAFAAIAFAAHYGATGDRESYELASRLFRFFTHWNFTPGVMPPKTTDVRPMISICPRMIAIVTAQELLCHGVEVGVEPYPGDASSWPSEPVASPLSIEGWIDRCIFEMERYFVKADRRVVMESVSPTGEVIDHFDGRLLNPGHAIEGAWFILREAAQRGDQRLVKLGSDMIDWMWQRGWDEQHGGLLYFRDLDDKPVQEYWADMKFWWPHNETIIATLMAYELTGQERFARMHQLVHDWSHRHFADREHGEWFGYLHRDGHVAMTTKGNLWKSFFHLPRMQWTCWQWLEQAGHRR